MMFQTVGRAFSSGITKGFARCFSATSCLGGGQRVGFIGLGNMGSGMAKNLIEKGHELMVFDVDSKAVSLITAHGAAAASSAAEVASQCAVIVTMLPDNSAVRRVYADEVVATAAPGSLLIDSSTVDPALSKEMASIASSKDLTFVDAPVSGGVNAAAAGTLTFMVGAQTEKDFSRAEGILAGMGKSITHCGQVGTGQAVKICNNMLLAISMIGVSETMGLGESLGLDPKLLAGILSNASGRCWAVDTYNPVPGVMENVPSSNNYQGGFGSALMVKDLGLAQDAATRVKAAAPLGSLAHQIYRIMVASGYATKDFSSCYQFLRQEKVQ